MWAGAFGYSAVKLFSKYSNLCDHGTWTLQTDGETDGQTAYCRITALCVASRCKKNCEIERKNTPGYSSWVLILYPVFQSSLYAKANKKLSYHRETARQLRMSISAGYLIMQCTEHRRSADVVGYSQIVSAKKASDIRVRWSFLTLYTHIIYKKNCKQFI